MPVRPENRARYPADWPAISRRIRTERAVGRCECDGRCQSRHCAAYYAADPRPGGVWTDRCLARNGLPHPATGSRVVLTVAHLDHQPEHSAPHNLLALCQACHLAYDRDHHAATRRARKEAK